ncbi:MAG TPA: PAS domain S-box protein [Candidatus Lokiarchaeia archaeon]|nr:PAS domain S-box protein [Candidatus Lokiarchaeia archaeon]
MAENTGSNEDMEFNDKNLLQLVPVSIWEVDCSKLNNMLDDLKVNGVTNFNAYFLDHHDSFSNLIRTITTVNVNDYSIIMYEARDKAELLGSVDRIFTPESIMAFKNAIIAFLEGESYFEVESTSQTLNGRMLNVLMKIRFPDAPEQLKKVIISIVDITRLKAMDVSVKQDSTIVSILAGLASRFLQPFLSKQDICEIALEYGLSLTSSENGMVLVFEESSLDIKAYASRGIVPTFFNFENMQNKEEAFENIMNKKESCFTNDTGDRSCLPDEDAMGITINRYLHVPVIASDQLIGHIILANSTRDYNNVDTLSIEQLAHVFTLAVLKFRAERKLQESETRYRDLVEQQTDLIVRWHINGQMTFGNEVYTQFFNLSQDEIKEASFFSIFPKSDLKIIIEWINSISPDHDSLITESQTQKLDGEIVWMQWVHRAIFNEKEEVLEIQSVGRYTTERKKYESELQSRIRLEQLTGIISSNFINLPPEKIDVGITQTLSLIGNLLDIDRGFVILFNDDVSKGIITHQWIAKGITSPFSKGHEILLDHCDWLIEAITKRNLIEFQDVSLLSTDERACMDQVLSADARFFGIVPVIFQHKIIGIFGIETSYDQLLQNLHLNTFLKVVAEIISLAIHRKSTELALRESEERYKNLFDYMRSGVAIVEGCDGGNDFRIKDLNKTSEIIENVKRDEIIGKLITEVFPGIREMGLLDVFRRVYATGIEEELAAALYTDERITGWRENFVYRLTTGEIVAVYNDVTEKVEKEQRIKIAEDNLRRSEEKYRLITEESNDFISVVSREYKFEYINEAYERLLGYKIEELIGRSGLGFIHPDDVKHALTVFAHLRGMSKEEEMIELRLRHKDGHYIFFEVKAKNIIFSDMPGLLLIGRDITDRKIATEKLEESEERYRIMLENASDMVSVLDENMLTEYVNENETKLLGFEKQELIGSSALDRIHPDEMTRVIETFKESFERGEGSGEIRIRHKDGHYIWFDIKGKTFVGKDGKKWALFLSRDISESRKLKEELLQLNQELGDSEKKHRLILDSTAEAIYGIDTKGNCTFCNRSLLRLLGYDQPEELIGKNMHELIHYNRADGTSYPLEACTLFASFRKGKKLHSEDEVFWKADGTSFPAECWSYPQKKGGFVTGAVVTFIDITERKHMESALKESERRFRELSDFLPMPIFETDLNLNIMYCNQAAFTMFGYVEYDLQKGLNIKDTIIEEDIAKAAEVFNLLARGEKIEGIGREYTGVKKDGTLLPVLINTSAIFKNNKPDGFEGFILDYSDKKRVEELKDELISFNQELEQRVEARTKDLEVAQEKLIRQEKLAAAGKISSTISHELRNPLAAISNSIYYLNMKLGDADEKIRKHVELIQAEVERSRQIITNLLDFTRIKPPEFSKVSLSNVIKTSLSHVTIPDNVSIETGDTTNDIQLEIDPDLMQQAFINIITNAFQAMPQGGNLYITIGSLGEQVTVAFKDSGVGIPPENIQKLFEPLFTTKKSGIGLGLALVKDIIDKHGGEIIVESDAGIGTTFTIIIPFKQGPV